MGIAVPYRTVPVVIQTSPLRAPHGGTARPGQRAVLSSVNTHYCRKPLPVKHFQTRTELSVSAIGRPGYRPVCGWIGRPSLAAILDRMEVNRPFVTAMTPPRATVLPVRADWYQAARIFMPRTPATADTGGSVSRWMQREKASISA